MMKKTMVWLAAVTALVGVSGCQNTVNTVENRQKEMIPDKVQTKYVSTDRFCRDRLIVQRVDQQILPDTGLMMIQISIYSNRTGVWQEFWSWYTQDVPYKIEYKIDWFDLNGMNVSTTNSIWIEKTIQPGETQYIQAVAPNVKCRDFKISLKEYGLAQ